MGFVLARPEIDTVIVGTHNPDHVVSNVKLVENDLAIASEARGRPLPAVRQAGRGLAPEEPDRAMPDLWISSSML